MTKHVGGREDTHAHMHTRARARFISLTHAFIYALLIKVASEANMLMIAFHLCFFRTHCCLRRGGCHVIHLPVGGWIHRLVKWVLERDLQQLCSSFHRMGNNISAGNELSWKQRVPVYFSFPFYRLIVYFSRLLFYISFSIFCLPFSIYFYFTAF